MMKTKKTIILALSIASISLLNINSYADTGNVQSNLEEINSSVNGGISTMGSASSSPVSKTVSGITYRGHTVVQTLLAGRAVASTVVNTSSPASSGYIGAHTALYREGTGSAISSSSWSYNKSSTTYHDVTTYVTSGQKGQNFKAKGTMKSYNTSTGQYVGTTLNNSPYIPYSLNIDESPNVDNQYLSYKTMDLTISQDKVQERIEMYENKGMIAAEGLNGNEGYILLEDMGVYENPSSPAEALRLQEERISKYGDYRDINVYDKDGETVIDTFRVWN